MSEHKVNLSWERSTESFAYKEYNREHVWEFEGGTRVEASAAPGFLGDPSYVDPEEAFVASLSSCHMLTFLALASKYRFVVDTYDDKAVGFLEKNADGKLALTRVTLNPEVTFSGDKIPNKEDIDKLHHKSHEECFIANSVKTEITVAF